MRRGLAYSTNGVKIPSKYDSNSNKHKIEK
jgi:hypothetical protein